MINSPLYLSNYPIGHLIEFQLTEHFRGKDFAEESLRIYKLGNIIPQKWMNEAVGDNISIQPLLKAAGEALKTIK